MALLPTSDRDKYALIAIIAALGIAYAFYTYMWEPKDVELTTTEAHVDSLVVLNQVVPVNASFSVPEQSLAAVRKYRADGELQVTAQVPNSGLAPVFSYYLRTNWQTFFH